MNPRALALTLATLTACAGDPIPPSHSPTDPSNADAPSSPSAAGPSALEGDVAADPAAAAAAASPADPHAGHRMKGMNGMDDMKGMDHGAQAPAASGSANAVLTCPMHPEVTSTVPAKCPKCGMTLVPKTPAEKK